jgi:hypothetical protein
MSLADRTIKITYAGDNSTVNFAMPDVPIVDDSAEVKVYIRDESVDPITQTLQTEGVDYTLTGSPGGDAFHTTVTFSVAPVATDKVVIYLELPLTQLLDLTTANGLPPESLEQGYDRAVGMIQQLNEQLTRVPKLRVSEQISEAGMELPEPGADEVWAWNAGGTAITTLDAAALATLVESLIDHTAIQNIGSNSHAQIDTHIASTSNPHSVTLDQIGPGVAKGDIIVFDGVNHVKLSQVSDGKILSSNSATATGLEWIDDAVSTSDETVKVTSNDSNQGYLLDKIISADGRLTVSEVNDGGNEDLQLAVIDSAIDHDALLNFVANEHIDHTSVNIDTPTNSGLSGGGDISSTRTLDLAANNLLETTVTTNVDFAVIYDTSETDTRKVLLPNLRAGMFAAPVGAEYLVVSTSAELTAERALRAGDGLQFTDLGANSTYTVDHDFGGLTPTALATGDLLVYGDADDSNNAKSATISTLNSFLDHDLLTNYVAAEHISLARHIHVDPSGSADETNLTDAITAASALTPTATNPVFIFMAAGSHTIDNSVSTPVVPTDVYIFGTGKSTRIIGASNARAILAMRSRTGFFNARLNIGLGFSMFEIDANGVNPDQAVVFEGLIIETSATVFDMVEGKIIAKNCSTISFGAQILIETANLTAASTGNLIEGWAFEDIVTIVDTQTTSFNFEITVTKCTVTRTSFGGGRLFIMNSGTLTSTYNTWGGLPGKGGDTIYQLGGTATLNDDYCTQTAPYPSGNFSTSAAGVTVVSNYGKWDETEFSLNDESHRPNTYFDTNTGKFINAGDSNSFVEIPLLEYTNFFE